MHPASKRRGRENIRYLSPVWFTLNMGTGSISILFDAFPYASDSTTMRAFSFSFFLLNLALFLVFMTISIYHYVKHPITWNLMIRHPVQSLYLGCFPMGGATLISVAVTLIYSDWHFGGPAFLYALWALWWVDMALSAASVFWLVHIMITRHQHDIGHMTAVWLLPVVTFIVGSATGGAFFTPLNDLSPLCAQVTLAVSVCTVVIGLLLAFMLFTIYLLRLIIYGIPEGASILSVFVPLGPSGQGGFAAILIGEACRSLFPLEGISSHFLGSKEIGHVVYGVCICISLMLWSIATMWLVFGLFGLYTSIVAQKTRFPFRNPYFGMIFPNGVYANLTIALYRSLNVGFFRVFGAIYSVATLLLWTVVFTRTFKLLRHGRIYDVLNLDTTSTSSAVPEVVDPNMGELDGDTSRGGPSSISDTPGLSEPANRSREKV